VGVRARRRFVVAAAEAGPGPHHPAPIAEAASFFHLATTPLRDQPCQGLACFVARHRDRSRWQAAEACPDRVQCLGRCHAAPATASDATRPIVASAAATTVLLERVAARQPPDLASYTASGGYEGLARAAASAAEDVVGEIEMSGLRGRGGAAFPTGRKWRAVLEARGAERFVVANADEGDPGAYIDRVLLEEDPHAVLEGLAIAGTAVGASRGYVYVRAEYPRARAAIEYALSEASDAGVMFPGFDVQIVDGHGSYVCGEETALLDAIEGRRPRVRPRPPYPADRGLHGAPTLVQNVETLVAVAWIARHGGAAYASIGTGSSRGTKAVSLNSLFARPGLYEVELGVPVATIVNDLGGGLAEGTLGGVLIGGPLAGVLPPSLLDTPFTIDALRAVGADIGHGGVVAFDTEHTSIGELAHHVFAFGADESCGNCTPCRVGARQAERLLRAAEPRAGGGGRLDAITDALAATSLCGHGTGLAAFARSLRNHYGEELESWLG
jgi:NADH:ubiquinone oxidoreductase subunit F (NADH-binding)